jgi:hypothetical protein
MSVVSLGFNAPANIDERSGARSDAFAAYQAGEQIYRLAFSKDVPALAALGQSLCSRSRLWIRSAVLLTM